MIENMFISDRISGSGLRTGALDARERIMRKVLLHERLTRQEIGICAELSSASVTNHTRRLIDRDLLRSVALRKPRAKRPIEELFLNPDYAVCLSLRYCDDVILAELLNFDASLIEVLSAKVSEHTQRGLLSAIDAVTAHALAATKELGRNITVVGIGLQGAVASDLGIVFAVRGIDDWQPCQPGQILPILSQAEIRASVWTQIMCKMHGLSSELKCDHRICYVEFTGRMFRVSTMQYGEVSLGRFGTSSPYLHRKIHDDGPVCYCGRSGCLARYLEEGDIDERVVAKVLMNILDEIEADHIGLEWQGRSDWLEQELQQSGIQVHHIGNGEEMVKKGLRSLTVESALKLNMKLEFNNVATG